MLRTLCSFSNRDPCVRNNTLRHYAKHILGWGGQVNFEEARKIETTPVSALKVEQLNKIVLSWNPSSIYVKATSSAQSFNMPGASFPLGCQAFKNNVDQKWNTGGHVIWSWPPEVANGLTTKGPQVPARFQPWLPWKDQPAAALFVEPPFWQLDNVFQCMLKRTLGISSTEWDCFLHTFVLVLGQDQVLCWTSETVTESKKNRRSLFKIQKSFCSVVPTQLSLSLPIGALWCPRTLWQFQVNDVVVQVFKQNLPRNGGRAVCVALGQSRLHGTSLAFRSVCLKPRSENSSWPNRKGYSTLGKRERSSLSSKWSS